MGDFFFVCFEFRVAKRERERQKKFSLFCLALIIMGDHTSSLYAEKVLLRRVRFLVVGHTFFFNENAYIILFVCPDQHHSILLCVVVVVESL